MLRLHREFWEATLSQGASFLTSVNREQGFLSTFFLYTLPIPPYGPVYPPLISPWSQTQTDTSRLGEEACHFGARWLVDFMHWVQKEPPLGSHPSSATL